MRAERIPKDQGITIITYHESRQAFLRVLEHDSLFIPFLNSTPSGRANV